MGSLGMELGDTLQPPFRPVSDVPSDLARVERPGRLPFLEFGMTRGEIAGGGRGIVGHPLRVSAGYVRQIPHDAVSRDNVGARRNESRIKFELPTDVGALMARIQNHQHGLTRPD